MSVYTTIKLIQYPFQALYPGGNVSTSLGANSLLIPLPLASVGDKGDLRGSCRLFSVLMNGDDGTSAVGLIGERRVAVVTLLLPKPLSDRATGLS